MMPKPISQIIAMKDRLDRKAKEAMADGDIGLVLAIGSQVRLLEWVLGEEK